MYTFTTEYNLYQERFIVKVQRLRFKDAASISVFFLSKIMVLHLCTHVPDIPGFQSLKDVNLWNIIPHDSERRDFDKLTPSMISVAILLLFDERSLLPPLRSIELPPFYGSRTQDTQ